jgi:hypothetical protein
MRGARRDFSTTVTRTTASIVDAETDVNPVPSSSPFTLLT